MKFLFMERLRAEDIDIAAYSMFARSTLEPPNHRFIVRGYQTFKLDREGRHEGGILTLERNNFPATEIHVATNREANIQGV